ncbi:MAG TPA: hypothetical protein VK992_05135 [Candidatus Caenarcaniphilales bacterium]|nr:hypothetical protein [Candidatus Caenarcaniphilales bacterium]
MSNEKREREAQPQDPGAYLGSKPELASDSIPGGVQRKDERIAGEATQSLGPAKRGANPDEGWQDGPEGHRQGRSADDDMLRAKG